MSEAASTRDSLLDGRVSLAQPARGYRVAIDAVLLAAAVPARPGETVLEAGTGVGAAALCLLARVCGVRATGIEIQPDLCALARANAAANGMSDRFSVVEADIAGADIAGAGGDIPGGPFDHVMANPPYRAAGRGTPPPDPARALATVEGPGGLGVWMAFCVDRVRPGGRVTMIHQADRLADLLAAADGRLGGLAVFPLWPAAGRPAGRVIVSGTAGSAAPLTVLPGLVLHEADGAFTAAAQAVLRGGAALDIGGGAPPGGAAGIGR